MNNLLLFIFAHFIGDWALQSRWLAENKEDNLFIMYAHSMIWTGCICFTLH